MEHAVYLADEYRVTPKLTVELGLRYSLFQNIGKTSVYALNDEYRTIDTIKYGKGDIFQPFSIA